MKQKNKEEDFLVCSGTLGASLLGDLLTKTLSGKGTIRAGEGTIRAGYGSRGYLLEKIDSATSFNKL